MDTATEIEGRLREFIITELGWDGGPATLSADYPLVDGRVVDSLGVLEIAGFIEKAYGIDVDEQELVFDNFSSLAALARYIQGKQSGPGAGNPRDDPPSQAASADPTTPPR